MDIRILKALTTDLKKEFPRLQTLSNFPSPNQKIKVPAIISVPMSESLERFNPRVLEQIDADTYVQNVGQYETQVKLHYYAKSITDQLEFTDLLTTYFDKQQVEDRTISPNIVLSYGLKPYERANLSLLDFHYINSGSVIKSGEIRTIFAIVIDSPKIITLKSYEIKDIRLDGKISETQIITK